MFKGQMSRQKLVNTVQADQVEGILWDAGRVKKVIKDLKNGVSRVELEKAVGTKVFDRAFKLHQAMEAGRAFLVARKPEEMGLITYEGAGVPTLTEKGRREVMVVHAYNPSFSEVAAATLLRNRTIWVRKYKVQKGLDEGMEIWKAWMNGQKVSAEQALKNVISHLLRKEDFEEISDDIIDVAKRAETYFPVRDEATDAQLKAFQDLREMAESVEEEDTTISDSEVDLPADKEGDESVESSLEQNMGAYMISSDPTERRRGYIWSLLKARQLVSTMKLADLYQEYVQPIVEHYTGQVILGKAIDYVTMPPTENERVAERNDFPYDSNITTESYLKYNPVAELRMVPGKEGKQVVQRRERLTREFNHELEADWEIDSVYKRIEGAKEWRLSLATALTKFELGKANILEKGWSNVHSKYFELVAKARYIKTLGPNDSYTESGFKQMLKKCLWYYNWA